MFLKDPAMESDTTDLTSAEDEWSRVTEIVPEFANSRQIRVPAAPAPGAGRSAPSLETPLLKTETALDHFRSVCPREPHQEVYSFIFFAKLTVAQIFSLHFFSEGPKFEISCPRLALLHAVQSTQSGRVSSKGSNLGVLTCEA